MDKKTYKRRPLRVFYDGLKKKFYVLNNSKKVFINVPSDINTLDKAQKFISKKLASNVTIIPNKTNTAATIIPFKKTELDQSYYGAKYDIPDPQLVNIYEEYLNSDPKKFIIDPTTLERAKKAYEDTKRQLKDRQAIEEKEARDEEKKFRAIIEASQRQLEQDLATYAAADNKNAQNQAAILSDIKDESKNTAVLINELKQEYKTASEENKQLLQDQINALRDMIGLLAQAASQSKQLPSPPIPQIQSSSPQPTQSQPQPTQSQNVTIEDLTEDKEPQYIPEEKSIPQTTTPQERKQQFESRLSTFSIPITINDIDKFKEWNTSDQKIDYLFRVASFLTNPSNAKWIYDHFPGLYPFFDGPPSGQFIPNDVNRGKYILKNISPTDYNSYVAGGKFPPEFKSYPTSLVNVSSNKRKPKYENQIGEGPRLPALYDDQIEDFFEGDPQFGGVISSDEIDKLPNKIPLGFIMNLDPRSKPGSHWVACYISGDSVDYFDPLADPPSQDFIERIRKKIKDMKVPIMLKFKVNKIQQQHGGSQRCGYHSIRFLDDRMNGIEFPMASRFNPDQKINNSKQGEKIVKDEFSLI